MTDTQLEEFEKIIGYEFRNKRLLERALTHSSYCNEIKRLKNQSNERLEFLGDAVLEVTVSYYLFEKYPDKTDGELTKLRASIVCEPTLALCSRQIKLGEWILLSKGEEHTGGRNRDSITSDAMEAVIGAIYRDGGFEPAQDYIRRFILEDIDNKKPGGSFPNRPAPHESTDRYSIMMVCGELTLLASLLGTSTDRTPDSYLHFTSSGFTSPT